MASVPVCQRRRVQRSAWMMSACSGSHLLIRCPLRMMTAVWTCQRGFDDAVQARDIAVKGDAVLARKLQAFLRASGLARLGSQRQAQATH